MPPSAGVADHHPHDNNALYRDENHTRSLEGDCGTVPRHRCAADNAYHAHARANIDDSKTDNGRSNFVGTPPDAVTSHRVVLDEARFDNHHTMFHVLLEESTVAM